MATRSFFARLPLAALLTAASFIGVAQLSCGGTSGPGKLVVTSAAPSGNNGDRPTIRIQFAQPAVAAGSVGTAIPKPPATLEPGIPIEGYWVDRQTLALVPLADLDPSTRYKVVLSGELARRTRNYAFDFVHRPLVVEGVWGVDVDALPVRPQLPMHFNQSVSPLAVLERCKLRDDAGQDIGLVLHSSKADGRKVVVGPDADLGRGERYQLICTGLSGSRGNEPLAQPFHLALQTHRAAGVARVIPGGHDVPTDELKIVVAFQTPVDADQARKHISAVPPIGGIDRGSLDPTGKKYSVIVNLSTKESYKIKIAAGLTDRYGQRITDDFVHAFRTGEARPRFSMETGIYALEPSVGGYPVWTRNLQHFDVECAAIPKDKVVELLTTSMNYDPWYNAKSEIDWGKLGIRKRQTRISIDGAKDNWKLERLGLSEMCAGPNERGLYLAELHSDLIKLEDYQNRWRYRNRRRVLANVTDLGVLLKTGSTSGLVWVTSLSSGKPVEGARVTLYSLKGKKLYSAATDDSGLVKTPGANQLLAAPGTQDKNPFEANPMSEWDLYRSRRLIAVVESKTDMAVVDGNWNNGIQVWNYGVREDRRGGKRRIRGFIQSDRGIYRPGETVHFKGLVREMAAGQAPRVPGRRKIKVHVEDSRGRTVFDRILNVSGFGGFHFDLPISEHAHLGDYHVTATIAGQSFREKFSVEEFRKLSFEVDLTPRERHAGLGAKMAFDLRADYLFGSPVADSRVRWTVERRDKHMHFARYPQYVFQDMAARGFRYWWYYRRSSSYGSFVTDGEGKTDAQGRMSFSLRDPYKQLKGPYDYIATARVKDSSNQVVSKKTVVTAHPTDFYLGMHSQEAVQAVDMPFAINAVAVRPDGKRVAARATLQLIRQDWNCTYKGGYRSYRDCKSTDVPVLERELEISKTGSTVQRIVPKQPGEYVVRIDSVDAQGRRVSASSWVWVLGKGQAFWSGDESDRLTLIANKDEYRPDEVAKLVPRTGMRRPTALITLERDGVIEARVERLETAAEGIEVALKGSYAPNVYASVALVTGRRGKGDRYRPRFKMGVVDLPVSAEHNRLEVSVDTEKDSYEPGDRVRGSIRVTQNGKPVRAEVALSVADEGVLQLIAYQTPDPMKTFYASFGLGLDSATNLNRIARLGDPLGYDADEGGDSGSKKDPIRSKFVSSAYWAPELYTDESGRARFDFEAPDNLTAFRLMAVAADKGRQFGSGDERVRIAKRVMAKPMLPRFLTAGDEALIGVVVHNRTGKAGKATVEVRGKGVKLARTRQVVTVNQTRRVVFPIEALDRDQASFTFEVVMPGGRDAVEKTIPINRGLHYDRRTIANGTLDSATLARARIPVDISSTAIASESTVTISVDRTGLAELEPALAYLVRYPYGCLEQTLSRFVPLAKARDLASSVGMKELDGPKMETFLRAGAAKVARHQHGNGHFSLWPNGPTYPHLTVYAVHGLLEAKRAGVEVDEVALDRGIKALARWANRPANHKPGGSSATAAMAAFVLADAGKADPGLIARLFKARSGLPIYGKAFLLKAMTRAGSTRAEISTLEQELLGSLVRKDGALMAVDPMKNASLYMSSSTRSTAMVLSALLATSPKHELIDDLADGLRKQRLSGGQWRSTQDNMYALVALADYGRAQKDGVTELELSGLVSHKKRLRGGETLSIEVPASSVGESLTIQARGRARYAIRAREARRLGLDKSVDNGLAVTREYRTVDGERLERIKAGQLLVVRLTVDPGKDRRWLALSDPLPAGFEVVNTKLASSASTARTQRSWRWTHVEMRDDRVQAFADRVYGRKPMVLEYLARATISGTFRALPAYAEAMYAPQVNGRTAQKKVEIR